MTDDRTTYTAIFSEAQRVLIANCLREYCKTRDEADAEADDLLAMIEEMPEVEKAEPGVLHGLCY